MTKPPPPDAETIACAVAGRYAGRWARSVARLAEAEDGQAAAPWFIDGFAGAELQRAALRGTALQPAAVAAVQSLDAAAEGGARIVLAEEDPGLIARLAEELGRAGAGGRVRMSSDPASAAPGEIVMVEAAFASVAFRLADAIGDEPALLRLAPLTARALPWTALEPLAELGGTDLLLRFPQEDFARQAQFTGPMADFPPHVRRVVEGCSGFLADARHGWLAAWRQAQRTAGAGAALDEMAERMRALLARAADDRLIRILGVQAGAAAVRLLLSTPHAAHALELNGALADASGAEPPVAPRPRGKSAKRGKPDPDASAAAAPEPAPGDAAPEPPAPGSSTAEQAAPERPPPEKAAPGKPGPRKAGAAAARPASPQPPAASAVPAEAAPAESPAVLDLFAPSAPAATPDPAPRGPDLHAVADDLHARHAGARVPFRDLLAGLGDSQLTPEQVRAALSLLKRAGRATYRSLDPDAAEVEFPAEPRVPAPRARKPRKPAPGELGLFDEPGE